MIERLKKHGKLSVILFASLLLSVLCAYFTAGGAVASSGINYSNGALPETTKQSNYGVEHYGSMADVAEGYAERYVVVKHKQLGGSHYAYTEGVSDDINDNVQPNGNEANFDPGSQLVLLTVYRDDDKPGGISTIEDVLIDSPNGVIRDPDVSDDGNVIVFSWKQNRNNDDYHLYKYYIEDEYYEQITFGQGIADFEPKFLANGNIVFSSSRDSQRVDCWKTVVSNLYVCANDGSAIRRVGYDQVHTTYPTVTSDGRVLYTRWDYNDRNQMYIQGVFQMHADGTNQTELYGNNSNYPTTLLHTRELPGAYSKYVTIVSGHHNQQVGKLAFIDLAQGPNSPDSIIGLTVYDQNGRQLDNAINKGDSVDTANADRGTLFKYPYAINDNELLYSRTRTSNGMSGGKNTVFDIYYYNIETETEVMLVEGSSSLPASQIVPIRSRKIFERPSTVNYGSDRGTFYIANVYEGDAMKDVQYGDAKYLRVVALEYRTYAVGAIVNPELQPSQSDDGKYYAGSDPHTPVGSSYTSWDVKKVVGIVDIEDDGSCMFYAPSEVSLYFQVLNADGEMIQSMRSWSTLMPGETYSCVGCHENKTQAPYIGGVVTDAMKKGVQLLKKDFWMVGEEYEDYDPYTDYKGFSYSENIQPILDESCTSCHSNVAESVTMTGATLDGYEVADTTDVFPMSGSWQYYKGTNATTGWNNVDFTGNWQTGNAGFGTLGDARAPSVGKTEDDWMNTNMHFRREFTLTAAQLDKDFYVEWQYDEDPVLYINGVEILTKSGYIPSPNTQRLTIPAGTLKAGTNVIAVRLTNATGGQYFDLGLKYADKTSGGSGAFSLEGLDVVGERERMIYKLSYLVLTGSVKSGDYYKGDPTNDYTNWISSISQCEMLAPYQYGSTQSGIMSIIRGYTEHAEVDITEEQIRAIACWIDLACPYRGAYDEASNWDASRVRYAEELTNKANYYNEIDRVAKNVLAGIHTPGEITIVFDGANTYKDVTGEGLVELYLENTSYRVGDVIEIYLPEGQEYAYVNIQSRMETALCYAPEGMISITLTQAMFDRNPTQLSSYYSNMITVWLPTAAEMQKIYNLAYSPFASSDSSAYPTVTTNSEYGSGNEFKAVNAIDGWTANKGHGTYPLHSWGPDRNVADLWLEIDFGRDVQISYLELFIRADFIEYTNTDHDTYITSVTVETAEGDTVFGNLIKTADGQKLVFDEPVTTTSIRLKDFAIADQSKWFAISELRAFGINI